MEEEINKQNDARANGKATFSEALYEFSLMSKEDFKKTHTGLIMEDSTMMGTEEMFFGTGQFEPADRFSPGNLRRQAESMANFQARMADRSVPDEFNAVEEGMSHRGSVKTVRETLLSIFMCYADFQTSAKRKK